MWKRKSPFKCPVCGKYEFPYEGSWEACEICGWIDDPIQDRESDEDCLANRMSLNQARKAYAEGKEIE